MTEEKERTIGSTNDKDMPKLQSPFKRTIIDKRYVLTDEPDPYVESFFNTSNLKAVEKLDGTNVSIVIEDGKIVRAYNRKNVININSKDRLWEGISNSLDHPLIAPYIDRLENGQHFGELIGLGIQENPMNLKNKLWVPFNSFARENLSYNFPTSKSFKELEEWMRYDIRSKMYNLLHPDEPREIIPEGVVFHNLENNEMYKLRSDMYQFYYEDPNHRPHKFKEIKPIVKKEPTKLDLEMRAHAKLRGTIPEEEWIRRRNEILSNNGIVIK